MAHEHPQVPDEPGDAPDLSHVEAAAAAADADTAGAAPSVGDDAGTSQPYRPQRLARPRYAGTGRGLPAPDDLVKLARTYVEQQRRLWPAVANALPALASTTSAGGVGDDAVALAAFAADFRHRHTTGTLAPGGGPDPRPVKSASSSSSSYRLAAAYLRYSCDNSNPRSLDDQLVNVLDKARERDLFIPWSLVFADASLSGADPARQGYCSLQAVVETLVRRPTAGAAAGGLPAVVMIDEFSRAGRDTLEWFRLAAWAHRLGMNVLGATDSFDLTSDTGRVMLHVFAMLSDLFRAQLREKVRRGMRGAARRRHSTGRPSLGYGLVPAVDAAGRPVIGADGRPVKRKAVHPPTMAHVDLAVRMLLADGKSPGEIAAEFNRLRVDGSDSWTGTSVRRMLSNPVYYGFDVYDRTRNEWDPETGKRRTVVNPRHQWTVYADPSLRVWDRRTFWAVQRRLRKRRRPAGAAPRSGGRDARQRPTHLLSGTLGCACGKDLKQVSGGKHATYACFDGLQGLHGCTMWSAKAAAILEEGVLDWLDTNVLTDAALDRVLAEATAAAARLAGEPQEDTAPLEAERVRLGRERANLVALVRAGGGSAGAGSGLEAVAAEIVTIGKQVTVLDGRLRDADRRRRAAAAAPMAPLTAADVRRHLGDLRGLLARDPAAAGLALRRITGRIAVTHEPYGAGERYGGRKGARWVLTFTPRVLSAAAGGAAAAGAPEAEALARGAAAAAATTSGGAAACGVVRIVVDRRKAPHERLAERVRPYVGATNPGTGRPYTRAEVAGILGCSIHVLYLAWRFAKTGRARRSRPSRSKAATAMPVLEVEVKPGVTSTAKASATKGARAALKAT